MRLLAQKLATVGRWGHERSSQYLMDYLFSNLCEQQVKLWDYELDDIPVTASVTMPGHEVNLHLIIPS